MTTGNVDANALQAPRVEPRPATPAARVTGTDGAPPQAQNARGQPAPAKPPAPKATIQQAQELARRLNARADFDKFRAEVQVDESTKRFVFQIRTRDEGRLIRQFPPEGILFLAQQLQAAKPGNLLLDEQV